MLKVFILEDDPKRLISLRKMLEGHDLHYAKSCNDVTRFEPPYDLILLDHDLGGRQMEQHEDCGLTFIKLIKDKINPEATIVYHSYNYWGAKQMYEEMNCRGYKAPYMWRDFIMIIDKMKYWDVEDDAKTAVKEGEVVDDPTSL